MPLHLLGKKSWNVYNPAAIERVRRDEAEAQRQAEEREKKALRDEADERVRLLRGGAPQPSDDSVKTIQVQSQDSAPRPAHRIQKRRLAGEDDTDCDIRIARERQVATTLSLKRQGPDEKEEDDSIVDSNGNISLIPVRHQHQQQLHNDSSGSAARKNSKIDEDPYTVYLSHAAGKDKDLATSKPWYYGGSSTGNDGLLTRAKWGDDSDRRRERESARIASQDPLAMMKRGVRQLREAEKQRQKWMEQRERDLREVEDLAVAAGPRRDKNRNMDDDGTTTTITGEEERGEMITTVMAVVEMQKKQLVDGEEGETKANSETMTAAIQLTNQKTSMKIASMDSIWTKAIPIPRLPSAATGIEIEIEIGIGNAAPIMMEMETTKADVWRTTVTIVAMTATDMVIDTALSVTIVLIITTAIVGGALMSEMFNDNMMTCMIPYKY
ncbi:hypothetical protein HRR78_007612 [Exophiala dermatitidis]|nr:hypothetical protein HRR75_007240 [Exophiala dermatitidis]KAJ4541265.1 hypothetical protein HRR78_007612 [Exophiala dermatitidis]